MLEIADRLLAALDAGERVAVATVAGVRGSAPRTVGTSMGLAAELARDADGGRVIGSIAGGCVEGAAVDACQRVLDTGSSEIARFGFTEDDAFAIGLSCGGELDVVVSLLDAPAIRAELAAAAAGRPAGLAIVVDGPPALLGSVVAGAEGCDAGGELDADLLAEAFPDGSASLDAIRALVARDTAAGFTGRRAIECGSATLELLVESRAPSPLLVIVGAVEFAAALAAAARPLGYHVVVCDARPAFATAARFPAAHEVIAEWPNLYVAGLASALDDRSAVCVLSHDDRFDIPVLQEALRSRAGFVGALGSRRTDARRRNALREAGVGPDDLARLRSPIGLDLGASTPEETGISILAEILAARMGATGRPLRELDGPIHRTAGSMQTTSEEQTQ